MIKSTVSSHSGFAASRQSNPFHKNGRNFLLKGFLKFKVLQMKV